jgi:hypothetical protein
MSSLLLNPKIHCCVHKNLWPVPIFNHKNSVPILPAYLIKIRFNIILPFSAILPSVLFLSECQPKFHTRFIVLMRATCPLHLISVFIWSSEQVRVFKKLVFMRDCVRKHNGDNEQKTHTEPVTTVPSDYFKYLRTVTSRGGREIIKASVKQ